MVTEPAFLGVIIARVSPQCPGDLTIAEEILFTEPFLLPLGLTPRPHPQPSLQLSMVTCPVGPFPGQAHENLPHDPQRQVAEPQDGCACIPNHCLKENRLPFQMLDEQEKSPWDLGVYL